MNFTKSAKNNMRVATFSVFILLALSGMVAAQSEGRTENIKRAAELFDRESFREALPILEKLVATDSSDDQAVYGLGVALIMSAEEIKDLAQRTQTLLRARSLLDKAKTLG